MFMVIMPLTKAQDTTGKKFEKKGFLFGTSLGVSFVQLNFKSQPIHREVSGSFPNFKIGTMVSNRLAVLVYLPGSIYKYKLAGRERDRGFEAILPSIQYWVNNKWWVLAGAGIGLDAPAFYDIKTEEERKFYLGKSFSIGAGYDVYQNRKFAIDIQGRAHFGDAKFPEGNRSGMAFNVLVGFNWY